MFRVEYLKVLGHPQLGELELFLSDIEEINNFKHLIPSKACLKT